MKMLIITLSIGFIVLSIILLSMQTQHPSRLEIAENYMDSVTDIEVKEIAVKWKDYIMQQYTYDEQFAAKNYMKTVTDSIAKGIVYQEWPNDYVMQKYVYDTYMNRDKVNIQINKQINREWKIKKFHRTE